MPTRGCSDCKAVQASIDSGDIEFVNMHVEGDDEQKKGLSFISNRQRRKEGTLRASGVGEDRTHAGLPQWSRVCPP